MAARPCRSTLRTGMATSLFSFHADDLQTSAQGQCVVDWTHQTGGRPKVTLSVGGFGAG